VGGPSATASTTWLAPWGAQISRETISTITDSVAQEVAPWQHRPLDEARFPSVVANVSEGDVVARYAPNRMPAEVERRYFVIRSGIKGAAAARVVACRPAAACCGSSTLAA